MTAYVGLGANLGDPATTLAAAAEMIGRLPESRITGCSSLYRSAPVDAGGPDFVNAVLALSSRLGPRRLLDALQCIEAGHGRNRPWRNAPRTLDLDLLLYGDCTRRDQDLMLPHPRMERRAFVLLPLAEIAPWLVTAAQLHAVRDQRIERFVERVPGWPPLL